jgi:tetratricopeptide (TPR) repeat protein
MEKIVFLILSLHLLLFGNIMDDYYIYQAQNAINNKQFTKAYKYYEQVSQKSDQVYYNMGNILSEQKNYKQAIVYYEKVKENKLHYKALHNMANSYVKLFEYEKAIEVYTKSLTLHTDPKTKYNLDLAKLEYSKKMEEEKKLKKLNQKFRSGKANEGFADEFDDSEELNITMYEKEYDENRSFISGLSKMDIDINLGIKIDENDSNETNSSKTDFSNYVQNKWDNKFDIKVHTLLIPFEKGNVDDSKKPW